MRLEMDGWLLSKVIQLGVQSHGYVVTASQAAHTRKQKKPKNPAYTDTILSKLAQSAHPMLKSSLQERPNSSTAVQFLAKKFVRYSITPVDKPMMWIPSNEWPWH